MHQIHWIEAHVPTVEAALAQLEAQVSSLGRADNYFGWLVARAPDGNVSLRPGIREESEHDWDVASFVALWRDPEAWRRAAWAAVLTHLRLEGPGEVIAGPILVNEAEHTQALDTPGPASGDLLARLETATREPCPAGLPAIIHETTLGVRGDALEWLGALGASDLARLPFVAGRTPDEWPAHYIGKPSGACPVYLAVDMHH